MGWMLDPSKNRPSCAIGFVEFGKFSQIAFARELSAGADIFPDDLPQKVPGAEHERVGIRTNPATIPRRPPRIAIKAVPCCRKGLCSAGPFCRKGLGSLLQLRPDERCTTDNLPPLSERPLLWFALRRKSSPAGWTYRNPRLHPESRILRA